MSPFKVILLKSDLPSPLFHSKLGGSINRSKKNMVIPLAAGRRRRKVALQKHLYFPPFTPTEVNPRDSLPVAVSIAS